MMLSPSARFTYTINVYFRYHIQQLLFRGVLSHRPHDLPQFLRTNGAIPIFVKNQKRLFDVCKCIWETLHSPSYLCNMFDHGRD